MDGLIFPSSNIIERSSAHPAQTLAHGLVARLAVTESVMLDALRIRHESYAAHGFIDPMPGGVFPDAYDLDSTARTVVLYHENMPIASVRVCIHDPEATLAGHPTMPGYTIFPDEVSSLIETFTPRLGEVRVVEASRLVCRSEYSHDLTVVSGLLRMGKYLANSFDANVTLISARPRHVPIYRRIGFKQIAEPRQYVGVRFTTALLMVEHDEGEIIQSKYPAMATVRKEDDWERRLLLGQPIPVFPDNMPVWRDPHAKTTEQMAA